MSITTEPFGQTEDGTPVQLFTLRNRHGIRVSITNFGGIVSEIWTPDRQGNFANITLGFSALAPYLRCSSYFGALIGRYANRIARGRFQLDGKAYQLPVNNGLHHLHGGTRGFNQVLWTAVPSSSTDCATLTLRYTSADGEQGYPGQLEVEAIYTLNDEDELSLNLRASTDQLTPVSLSNHTYFNLAGGGKATILDHELMIHAQAYTPVDAGLIPSGEIRSVKETPFDFTCPQRIGARIDEDDEQLRIGGGYDHNFVLDGPEAELRLAARVSDPVSGRVLELFSDAPGLQFYSSNFLDGSAGYAYRSGLCLEPQRFPDAPNQPHFPDALLRPGELYQSRMTYRFRLSL